MLLSDFKRRWVLSKINPILFYLPLAAKPKVKKNKAHIIISPRTQIDMSTFTPYPQIPDKVVPYYTFYPKKEDTVVTGSFEKYKSFLTLDTEEENDENKIPTYGCCYRLYKKNIDEETGEISYISVKTNGELDEEDSFDSLHFNQQSFYLEEGTYYYYEEVSSEGDMIFFDTLEIKVFKKDESYQEEEDIIKDYADSETPEDPETLYIHYLSLDDNKKHETFNGYKGYIYKERKNNSSIVSSNEEEEKSEFKYFIYHEPKSIKVYTEFKEVNETYTGVTKSELYTYSQSTAQGIPWVIGPIGKGESNPDGTSPTDIPVYNYMYKIVPHVYKTIIMNKQVDAAIETDIKKSVYMYDWILSFAYNFWDAGVGMYDTVGWALQKYKVSFPKNESHKTISINGVVVTQSYLMSYSQYQIRNFPHAEEDEFGFLYNSITPEATNSDTSNLQTPQYNVGVGIAMQRGGEANNPYSYAGEQILIRAKTENELGENQIEKNQKLHNTIFEVDIKTGVHQSVIEWTNMVGESGGYTATLDLKDEAKSYASAEDCAYFAVKPAKRLSASATILSPS